MNCRETRNPELLSKSMSDFPINLVQGMGARIYASQAQRWRCTCIVYVWDRTNKCLIMRRDDVIKWKHFPRYWPFVRGIHRSPVNSRTKPVICAGINGWVNNREAGDWRCHRAHYDVTVMAKTLRIIFDTRRTAIVRYECHDIGGLVQVCGNSSALAILH